MARPQFRTPRGMVMWKALYPVPLTHFIRDEEDDDDVRLQFLAGANASKKKTSSVLQASAGTGEGDGDEDEEESWVLEQLKKGVSGYKAGDDGKGSAAAAKAAMENHANAAAAAMVCGVHTVYHARGTNGGPST
eukprot:1186834-Prorocentrum_minimum.AAC.3